MSKIEPELITGMGYVGTSPGVLYRMTPAGKRLTASGGSTVVINGAKDNAPLDSLTLYGGSTQGSTTGAQLIKNYEFTLDFIKDNDVNGTKINEELSVGDIFVDGGYLSFVSQETLPFEIQFELHDPDDGNYKTLALFKPQKGFNKTELSGYKFSDTQKRVSLQIRSVLPPLEAISWHISELFVKVGKTGSPWEPYTGGKPSPSPEYPQEIESVGMGEVEVSVGGGNLFDDTNVEDGFVSSAGVLIPASSVRNEKTSDFIRVFGSSHLIARLNGTPTSEDNEKYLWCGLSFYDDTKKFIHRISGNSTVGATEYSLVAEIPSDAKYVRISYRKYKDVVAMLNIGSTALPYEPYKPPQTAIIPTPDGLPGIPVTSGGNYTDADGQQWVCDTVEYKRGKAVRMQRIEGVDLKTLNWLKQNRVAGAGGFYFSSKIEKPVLFGLSVRGTISNIGICKNPYTDVGDYVWALTNGNVSEIRIGFADSTIDSIEKLKKLLDGLPEAYAMYCLADPIETPLSPESTAQLAALRTYSPTTTVVNDAGAGMSVGYKGK